MGKLDGWKEDLLSQTNLGLSPKAYIDHVLNGFNMETCGFGKVAIVKGDKLSKNQWPKNGLERDAMKNILYASAIDSLMYAQVCTRPNIALVVNILGRYIC